MKDGSVYFITINGAPRHHNQFAIPGVADAIGHALRHYQSAGKWWIHLLLLMPDHLHGLVSFSREASLRRTVSDWKRYLARTTGIEWQRDFFDHRIRNEAGMTEKWHYIRENPVRRGLAASPDDWPYQWAFTVTAGRDGSPSRPPLPPGPPPPAHPPAGGPLPAVSEKPPYPPNPGSPGRDGSPSRPLQPPRPSPGNRPPPARP